MRIHIPRAINCYRSILTCFSVMIRYILFGSCAVHNENLANYIAKAEINRSQGGFPITVKNSKSFFTRPLRLLRSKKS